ncbi:MAG: arginine--tRNA ligase [Bryobacteraceae bacterium]|nr:arginine--tRNA ligase [Bryobacteraceae bacterium]
MFHQLEKSIPLEIAARLSQQLQIDAPVQVEQPRDPKFGEFALPIAFQLARQMKQAPKAIAEKLVSAIGTLPGVAALEIAGNGYLNVRLDRARYLASLMQPPAEAAGAESGKVIIEHTNINPNKAAHIGHLRNAILGDTFARMLRASGETVEVQNYIDNTGVQVADVVVGFRYLEKKSLAEVEALSVAPRFDYYCWDLYARTSTYYKDHPDSLAWRAEVLHSIEGGTDEVSRLGHLVADAIVGCHLRTMARLGIVYDVLPRESEILHLQFWAKAFELLKERKALFLETEGKNKGCWVMPASAFRDATRAEEEDVDDSKVIVRSNGIVTYVGKDIAYQLWKFGLLGKDFFYEPLAGFPGVMVSTAEPQPASNSRFGGGQTVYNVIDSRQSYLQDVVVAGLRALGYHEQAAKSVHFSYEMVALTPRTCVDLRIPISEEDAKKAYVEVSGRKGLGVKADDLLDELIATAGREVGARHAEATEEDRRMIATQIAVAALRYFMLKFTRNTVIAFDLQEALSFTGETGPYVQYSAVRAGRILTKLTEPLPDYRSLSPAEIDDIAAELADENLWQLTLSVSKLESALARSIASGEPAHLARFAFQLAQSFSTFYENYPVLTEKNPRKKLLLLWMTDYFARQLRRTLDILGIPVPSFM